MRYSRQPAITKRVLAGLTNALSKMEADDLTDLPDDECEQMEAAGNWLTAMYEWMEERDKEKAIRNSL